MLILLLLFVLLTSTPINAATEFELTSSSLCEICQCGPGPGMNPKEKAVCQNIGDGKRIKIASLPHFVTSLVVENATGGVVIMRGAVRVNNVGDTKFRLVISKAAHLDVTEKAITLLGSESEAHVSIEKVENINFSGRAISASKPGRFFLRVSRCGTVSVDSRAFDVLNDVTIDEVKSLRLSTSAFKPNVPIETPEMTITLHRIGSIPQFPTEVFSSALSISMLDCNISEIESSAFSGFSVINVTFVRTNINRVHSRAFPEASLLNRLLFENCSLTSVAEKAISSAISSLEITNSALASLSEEAISSHVAKVDFTGNNFQTLSHRSFVFQSWNEILFSENRIMFMETGALLGIDLPGEADVGNNVTFIFSENNIHYANKDALKVSIPATVEAVVSDNVFYKYCECGLDEWLSIVCGGVKTDNSVLDLNALLQVSSQCQVPELARPCFQEITVKMSAYDEKFCLADTSDDENKEGADNVPPCMLIHQMTPWEVFRQHIEVSSNRGILLLLLLFALACSFVVAVITLFRWIVYTIQSKTKCHNKSQEWNFTKIEERGRDQTGSEHYENLPLTSAECFDSSPTTGEQTEEGPTSLSVESEAEEEDDGKVTQGEAKKESETTHTTLEAEVARCKSPPKPTFYDEMICLLQEKLDDPNNYGTVADSQTTCFYQDPQDLENQK